MVFVKKALFGCMGKQHYVQQFCEFVKDGTRYLLVGRKGLTVQIFDIDRNFKCISTKQLMTNQDDSDFFISLDVVHGEFRASTGLGYCYFLNINSLINSCFNDFSMSFGLQGPISFFKVLPASQDSLVIIGGKDREIAIVDVDSHLTIWKSKTPKKFDKLYQPYINKERESIWIQDVVIVKEDGSEVKFIAATRFGKLLFFNTEVSRLPIDEIEIGENPIKHLKLISENTLFIADSFDNVTLFDIDNQKIINKFQMKTGALSSMSYIKLRSALPELRETEGVLTFITSYVDSSLRIYKIEDGYKTLLCGVRLGNRPSPNEIFLIEKDNIPSTLASSWTDNKRIRTN